MTKTSRSAFWFHSFTDCLVHKELNERKSVATHEADLDTVT